MMYSNNLVAVIKCNGSILRECPGSVVQLPFGSEYSILIKNKDSRRAVLDIEVDGKNVLNGHKLIIDSNTSQEIKGFMRDMQETNRFKFINKTKEIQKHRGDRVDDGLVRISYQFESNYSINTWNQPFSGSWSTTSVPQVYYSSFNNGSDIRATCCMSSAPLPEEGITVKGEKIQQDYVFGSTRNLDPEIYTIILQLKGLTHSNKHVNKPLTVQTKIKCETCGRKNKSSNKFCFNCGTFLH